MVSKKLTQDIPYINTVISDLHTFIVDNTLFVERKTYALLLNHVINAFIKLLKALVESNKDNADQSTIEVQPKLTVILNEQLRYQNYLETIRSENVQDEQASFGSSEPELQMLIQDFSID